MGLGLGDEGRAGAPSLSAELGSGAWGRCGMGMGMRMGTGWGQVT